jgi:hypothetical protein
MGYIREPKNVDLLVGPSVLTEATIRNIAQAIAQYKKTGIKPISIKSVKVDSKVATHTSHAKTTIAQTGKSAKREAKI